MKSAYRIGILSLFHESNTFAPGLTELEHFKQGTFLCGPDIIPHYQNGNSAIAGFLEVLAAENIEAVPLLAASATPGPTVSAAALEQLWQMAQLEIGKAGPLDGILVAPHGAGVSQQHRDMDGWWLSQLRALVGPDVPLIGILDPHANVTAAMLESTNALLPYKTNPHLDAKARGIKAAQMMAQTLEGKIRPAQKCCAPPLLINIEKQHTETPPLSNFYELCNRAEERPGILDVSLLIGFQYADVQEMNSGVLVISDGNEKLAEQTALELGNRLWDMRENFLPSLITPAQAIAKAKISARPVCFLDMGDNIGGGATGEGTWLLHALTQNAHFKTFFCLYDPIGVQHAMQAGLGAMIEVELGGKTCPDKDGIPFKFKGFVKAFPPHQFEDRKVRHGGKRIFKSGPCVLLQSADNWLYVLVTTQRLMPNSPEMLAHCGLRAEDFDVIVAKGVNAPLGAFDEVCRTFIKVNTPGVTSADFAHFTFQHRRSPLFPLESSFVWQAQIEELIPA